MRLWGQALAVGVACVCAAACAAGQGSIGAMLGQQHGTGELTVREVPAGMEAHRAGLEPGDRILLIDGRDVRTMDPTQVHEALVGPIGSTVDLTVLRGEQVLRLRVKRGKLR